MDEDTEVEPRPRLADVAFGLVLAAAAALLVLAALVPLQIGPTVEQSREQAVREHLDVAALEHGLVLLTIAIMAVGVIAAGLLVLFAFRFRAGRRRSRIGIIVITLLLVVTVALPLILVAVVLAVAAVLMFLPPVAAWLQAVAPKRAVRRS